MELDFSQRTRGPAATKPQQKYLRSLFDDHGYTSEQRKAKLQLDFGVSYIDELTISEASQLIDELKPKEDL